VTRARQDWLVEVVDLLPTLRMLRFPVGQAYLWRHPESLTLIDTGLAGSGPDIARVISGFGLTPPDLDRVVLTHFHDDHAGAAAEVGDWGGATVMAHRREAPIIRSQVPGRRLYSPTTNVSSSAGIFIGGLRNTSAPALG
jgi:glyoxylase-like metal-dependent hydrolase (beta-lactamase superfamily II)